MNLTIHFLDIYFFPNDEENNNDFKNKLTYTIIEVKNIFLKVNFTKKFTNQFFY
jgi:hypothetical protein